MTIFRLNFIINNTLQYSVNSLFLERKKKEKRKTDLKDHNTKLAKMKKNKNHYIIKRRKKKVYTFRTPSLVSHNSSPFSPTGH